ncbi:hypothetical protein Tco_1220887 [Tanacetum coccineum]
MIGSLMYLTASRPDLVFAVCMCARYQSKPTKRHLEAIKRVFRYLQGTINMGLWYRKTNRPLALTAYAERHAGCQTLKKHICGEYIAMSGVLCPNPMDAGLNYLIIALPFTIVSLMYCDNKSDIALCATTSSTPGDSVLPGMDYFISVHPRSDILMADVIAPVEKAPALAPPPARMNKFDAFILWGRSSIVAHSIMRRGCGTEFTQSSIPSRRQKESGTTHSGKKKAITYCGSQCQEEPIGKCLVMPFRMNELITVDIREQDYFDALSEESSQKNQRYLAGDTDLKFQPLPEVRGKRKGERKSVPEQACSFDIESVEGSAPVVTSRPVLEDEWPAGQSGIQDEGQAGPNPGNDTVSQTLSTHGVHVGPNLEHTDAEATDATMMDSRGACQLYWVVKATADTKTESMVSVTIHQDTSVIPPMTSPVIDLVSVPDSPTPQQVSSDSILLNRLGELEQHIADLVDANQALEERLDKHGSRLYRLENQDIPNQVSKAVDEIVTDAVDWAMHAPLRRLWEVFYARDIKDPALVPICEAMKKNKRDRAHLKTPS